MNFAFEVVVEAFLLMPNHYHLILSAPLGNMSEALAWVMRESAREMNRSAQSINQVWGSRFYRSLITSEVYYRHAYKYLYRNAVQAGLCENVLSYPYSTLRSVIGRDIVRIPTRDRCLDDFGWDSCLNWLNRGVSEENWEIVRRALKKSEFKLAKSKRGEACPLESSLL